jgi:hypothetical protein
VHLDSRDLDAARSALRDRQATYILTWSHERDVTAASLEAFSAFHRYSRDYRSDRVRRGSFTYVKELEVERLARGEALIRRVQPGPFEDPVYFALLAYQAASLELAWDRMAPAAPSALFASTLLGTAHEPEVNAISVRFRSGAHQVVIVNSGLVDFVYQAAKSIVAAAEPRRSDDGRSLVSATFGAQSAREYLQSNQEPVDRLYRTLEAYFFHGYPRAFSDEVVVEEHHPPLALLVGLAERWIVGHEYGHKLVPSLTNAPREANVDIVEEYFADYAATAATVLSAGLLDAVPPEFPLASAIFTLTCLDIIQRAHRLVRTGIEQQDSDVAATHPTHVDRVEQVINCFRRFFDVRYTPDHLFELDYVVREHIPEEHGFSEARRTVAYSYAESLWAVWKQTRERLLEDYHQNRPLHPFWGPRSVPRGS